MAQVLTIQAVGKLMQWSTHNRSYEQLTPGPDKRRVYVLYKYLHGNGDGSYKVKKEVQLDVAFAKISEGIQSKQ